MAKPWRLTRHAETSLVDIARWTIETFGPRQAVAYEEDLLAHCVAISETSAQSQSCRVLIDPSLPEDLRFCRAGQHFIIFIEYPDAIIIVDFLHSRSDLATRISALADQSDQQSH